MEKDFKNMDSQDIKFNDLFNIDAYVCILGLSFPESANDFQKAALTLAHLMAAIRESVLKGANIPENALDLVQGLAHILHLSKNVQL